MTQKACNRCSVTKDLSSFYNESDTVCSLCRQIYANAKYHKKKKRKDAERVEASRAALRNIDTSLLCGNLNAAVIVIMAAKTRGLFAPIDDDDYDGGPDSHRCKLKQMELAVEQMAERAKDAQ